MYVKKIESNIKGGVCCELGPKTLVLGPNGSGKSAVLGAVELALTKGISDLSGREVVKRPIDQLVLCPPGKTLYSHATLDNNEVVIYRVEHNGKGGAKTPEHRFNAAHFDPETVLPLRPLRAALTGSPATCRKFFLQRTDAPVSTEDVLSRIPKRYHDLYKQLLQGLEPSDPVINLIAAQEEAAKRARSESSAAKQGEVIAAGVGQGLPPPPTEAQLDEAKKKVKVAQAAVEDAIVQHARVESVQKNTERIENLASERNRCLTMAHSLDERSNALASQVAQAEAARAALPPVPELNEGKKAIRILAAHLVQAFTGHPNETPAACPLCSSATTIGKFFETHAFLANHDAKTAAGRAAVEAATAEVMRLRDELKRTMDGVRQWRDAARKLESELMQMRSLAMPDPNKLPDVASLRVEVQKAQDELQALLAASAAWDSAQRAMQISVDASGVAEQWSEVANVLKDVIGTLMASGQSQFVQSVQQYLPSYDRFALRLNEGSREVCQVGFERGEVIHTALSGAEWARMVAAMSAACAPKNGMWIIIPEERAFDPTTLGDALEALTHVKGQVIVASPIKPVNFFDLCDKWTTILTARHEHRGAPVADRKVEQAMAMA